eukprot:NODE_389_length_882_cov_468.247682_g381_i0.p1 GENE.NODE_389_length_882_cov_468.247682_g381_i0~~NODE_389_length_882_cov_468.247682_g381_i0.p1  ORF type:complete len:224 (-),score=58.02 NODE_389_length_882_cov_468.247682_g381_i0:110-781(-)
MRTLLVLGLVACAAAVQVCLPEVFQWSRSGQFVWDRSSRQHLGYEGTEEYFDHTERNYRVRQNIFVNREQYFEDRIMKGKEEKTWTIRTHTGSGSITCKVEKTVIPNVEPCLLKNATYRGTTTFAGATAVSVWDESAGDGHNGMVYQEVIMAASDNVPVLTRTVVTNLNLYEHNLYYNYAAFLPSDAFDVPSFCPQNPPEDAEPLVWEELVGQHPVLNPAPRE